MSHTFDAIDPDPAHLTGLITGFEVLDPDLNPNRVLQSDLDWSIKVDWNISGLIAGGLGGVWQVRAYAESIGGGFEGQVGADVLVDLSAAPATASRSYTATVDVSAGFLPDGAYKLVVLINYTNGGLPQQMAAFVEGPVVQMYTP